MQHYLQNELLKQFQPTKIFKIIKKLKINYSSIFYVVSVISVYSFEAL